MATVIVSDCNMVERRVDAAELGFAPAIVAGALTDDETYVSDVISPKAPKPLKARLMAKLSANSATFSLARHAGTPNFTPGADCIAVSRVDSTDRVLIELDTTAAKPMVSVQIVEDDAGAAGSTLAEIALYLSDKVADGRGHHEVQTGFNALVVGTAAPFSDAV